LEGAGVTGLTRRSSKSSKNYLGLWKNYDKMATRPRELDCFIDWNVLFLQAVKNKKSCTRRGQQKN
jgi:hypothetical protein